MPAMGPSPWAVILPSSVTSHQRLFSYIPLHCDVTPDANKCVLLPSTKFPTASMPMLVMHRPNTSVLSPKTHAGSTTTPNPPMRSRGLRSTSWSAISTELVLSRVLSSGLVSQNPVWLIKCSSCTLKLTLKLTEDSIYRSRRGQSKCADLVRCQNFANLRLNKYF